MAISISSEASNSNAEKEPCKTCKELIPVGAIKCTKCNSYQDWTRYLLRWTTVIVVLIGLAPLWGAAISLYELAFSKRAPVIEALITACTPKTISLAYINAGSLDGIVTGYNFKLEKNGKLQKKSYVVKPNTQANLVITPEKPPTLVDVKAFIGETPAHFIRANQTPSDFVYHLTVKWSDFSDAKHELKRSCTPK